MNQNVHTQPHRRYNPLTGEWLLLSPHRAKRPWQGEHEMMSEGGPEKYDSSCYLCPGNRRVGGKKNPCYTGTFVFDNDFSALIPTSEPLEPETSELFQSGSAEGICRVICFSDRHDLTLARMTVEEIAGVVSTWMDQSSELGKVYQWVQIFENKGKVMGCSNQHPHGQIWASTFLPEAVTRENERQKIYYQKNNRLLLLDYLHEEIQRGERIVANNETWVAVVPYWAVWPFEILLIPRRRVGKISDLNPYEQQGLAKIMKEFLVKYDNIFMTSFPYSMGWHGVPNTNEDTSHWQLHCHYYPPLLLSATVKKFMVGYEMLANPQRDITPETAAKIIRGQAVDHYKDRAEV